MDTYEKKYKEALERAIVAHKDEDKHLKATLERIFPELKESEDEKIRKALIDLVKCNERSGYKLLNNVPTSSMLTWLESQIDKDKLIKELIAKQKGLDYPYVTGWRKNDKDNKPQVKHSVLMFTTHGVAEGEWLGEKWCQYRWSCKIKDEDVLYWLHLSDLENLEKQGEQKPVDKVEPKFHKGDWIVHQGTENIYQVVAVIDNQYQLKYGDNYTIQKCADVDRCARLYDVSKDAKKGDVLSDSTTIFIFKDLLSDGSVMSYCDYDTDSGESDAFCPFSVNLMCSKITLATKEQRDTLERAITNAGYRWNKEECKLEKI